MYLELDGSGPLHGQLTRALKGAMFSGSMHTGTRLPPSRLLARELGVSRNTVLAAYEQLRAEGFLDGRVGSGSFVAPLPQGARKDSGEPAPAEPQSRYARRGRRFHDHAKVPGLPIPGVRHAFQYGVPLTHPAITTAWARALSQAAQYTSPFYPMTRGLPALREAVCDYLVRRRGIAATPEDVLIVSGTQQAIALTARVLLDPGERAAIEEPHYFALRTGLLVHGAELYPVSVDEDGLRCEELPQPAAKLVCVSLRTNSQAARCSRCPAGWPCWNTRASTAAGYSKTTTTANSATTASPCPRCGRWTIRAASSTSVRSRK